MSIVYINMTYQPTYTKNYNEKVIDQENYVLGSL